MPASTPSTEWRPTRRRTPVLAAPPTPRPIPVEEIPCKPDWFGSFATRASGWLGSKWAFAGAGLIIVIWGLSGPLFHFSDTWQLVINTGTTIVTFLMVFLIQNTQNRDARAINLKLNELIRAVDAARDQMIDIESLSDLELNKLQTHYETLRANLPPEAIEDLQTQIQSKIESEVQTKVHAEVKDQLQTS